MRRCGEKKPYTDLTASHPCDVNVATDKMTVNFDEKSLDFDSIKSAVEGAGYGLEEDIQVARVELAIGGMTCAACSAAVERAARKLDGVISAQVNLATNRGIFEYDPSKVKLADIKSAIKEAGYQPSEAADAGSTESAHARGEKGLLVRLIVAIVFRFARALYRYGTHVRIFKSAAAGVYVTPHAPLDICACPARADAPRHYQRLALLHARI